MNDATYQLVLLGSQCDVWADTLLEVIRARLAEIGEGLEKALQVIHHDDIGSLKPTAPTVGVYLGGDGVMHAAQAKLFVDEALPILPVVDSLKDFSQKVPLALAPINGIAVGSSPDFFEAANLVLENFSLLRRSRKLFISYLRAESTPIAHQLRVAFDDMGYDAFLDTSSVPKGDDFQSVLWHRLLDSDVMIVLDTPNFLASRWTPKELAEASAMGVGMLRVAWPGVTPVRGSELAQQLYLDEADFEGDRLKDDAINRIMQNVAALRARCIAARHTSLVVEFCNEATKAGAKTAIQPGRYVLALLKDGRRIAAVPAVGVPDAQRYHEASERFPLNGELASEAVLIYDHRGMLPTWTGFLNWLDDYLPVRGLKVTDTAEKLGAVK